jgi:ribosome-binding factor A
MRRVPEMTFKDDTVLEKGLSVLKLLAELKNKKHNQDSKVEENNKNG